jgi:hypothetical protein
MQGRVKRTFGRLASAIAILTIALHTVLAGAAAPAAASTLDPLSVMCHSGTPAAVGDQTPDVPAPSSTCDHCTLCGAAAAPPLGLDRIAAGQLLPKKLLLIVRPAVSAARAGLTGSPHQARGPPHLT